MKQQDYIALGKALEIAKQKAMAYANYDDGGTCNFDSPLIQLKGTSSKTLEKWFSEYGVYQLYQGGWYIIGCRVLCGQGYRRTKMAEEFAETLKQLGYTCYVHYVMD